MSKFYDDFEKRFDNAWFSAGWADVEVRPKVASAASIAQETAHKDLETLQCELEALGESIKNIASKQLRLSNLAKFYNE